MNTLRERFEDAGRINLRAFGVDLKVASSKEFACVDVSCCLRSGDDKIFFYYYPKTDKFEVMGADTISIDEEKSSFMANQAAHTIVEQLHFSVVGFKAR
jgi:hypothetical protein